MFIEITLSVVVLAAIVSCSPTARPAKTGLIAAQPPAQAAAMPPAPPPRLGAIGIGGEVRTYTYDVHGRVVQVDIVDDYPTNAQVDYTYDAADNRTAKTVTGSYNPGVVILPLPGYPIIPLGNPRNP